VRARLAGVDASAAVVDGAAPRTVESQVFALQPQWLATPEPPQVDGRVHVPQSSELPQPSEAAPHVNPSDAQVFGVQTPEPHWFAPPTPQTSVPLQAPQLRMPTAPVADGAALRALRAQVVTLHSHLLGVPLAAHVEGAVQVPQFSDPPHRHPRPRIGR